MVDEGGGRDSHRVGSGLPWIRQILAQCRRKKDEENRSYDRGSHSLFSTLRDPSHYWRCIAIDQGSGCPQQGHRQFYVHLAQTILSVNFVTLANEGKRAFATEITEDTENAMDQSCEEPVT